MNFSYEIPLHRLLTLPSLANLYIWLKTIILWLIMDNEKLSILRLLIENAEKEFSIRQISKARKINYKSAHGNIMSLEKEGAVKIRRHGNVSLCSFSRKFGESVFLVEHKRMEEFLKNKNFQVLHSRLKKINSQFILLVFGSQAKGKAKKHSDIDLLCIAENAKKIEDELDLLPMKIHLTSISYKDFMSMLKSKEQTVVSEAVKKNIILFGMEDYYRLIENAQ